tara:strand:- start:1758 stop:2033 length:276 start_codon:yes stop_codon:yes gene_type:complete
MPEYLITTDETYTMQVTYRVLAPNELVANAMIDWCGSHISTIKSFVPETSILNNASIPLNPDGTIMVDQTDVDMVDRRIDRTVEIHEVGKD